MAIAVVFFDLGDTLVTSDRKWIAGAKALLKDLHQAQLRLGIISNTEGVPDRVAILKLLPTDFKLSAFEEKLVIFSSEVGAVKPSRAIFDKAVAQTGLPTSQCLFCGENVIETLMAQQAGLRALRVLPPPGDLPALSKQIREFVTLSA
ncbi:hypothetical protein C7T35_34435 [Variovorax sp. WS11]|uniref:HAD family hydrolase n=1 Tax=Variovorax sp. WS11 TaxID=1105204 RepID=UPI000D0CD657|nr:HAD-IA family hydrolase [Variovorax sp. WS11]NDZ17796.1 HAD-IA family hydrolase [Variovorax sp. WS11]PSL80026.1 hypothetical protein C7T35_34435 [Variovorax sp. WS11]